MPANTQADALFQIQNLLLSPINGYVRSDAQTTSTALVGWVPSMAYFGVGPLQVTVSVTGVGQVAVASIEAPLTPQNSYPLWVWADGGTLAWLITTDPAALGPTSIFGEDGTLTALAGISATAGSPVVTMTSTTGLLPGWYLNCAGVPAGTAILSVDSGTQVTLVANATSNEAGITGTAQQGFLLPAGFGVQLVYDSYNHFWRIVEVIMPGGAVSSVTNADGTLTISPTTGAVVASLALAHDNPWTGHTAFGNHAAIDDYQLIFPGFTAPLVVGIQEVVASTVNAESYYGGLTCYLLAKTTGESGGIIKCFDTELWTDPTDTSDFAELDAIFGEIQHKGSGTVGIATGVNFYTYNTGPGIITTAYGVFSTVYNGDTGNIGTAYGVYSQISEANAGGSITTAYGLFLDVPSGSIGTLHGIHITDQSNSGTSSWQIYSDGVAPSYFGGPIGLNQTAPDAAAQLQGDSTTQGWLPPRMTTLDKTSISSPPTALLVFDTDLDAYCFWDGSAWVTIASSTGPLGPAGGDLSGTYPDPSVAKIEGWPLNIPSTPSSGDVLTWNGSDWTNLTPTGGPPTGPAGGDLSGSYPDPTVSFIEGTPLGLGSILSSGDLLTWNGAVWLNSQPLGAPPTGPAGGDLGGTYPNPTVVFLQGYPLYLPPGSLANTILTWDGTNLFLGNPISEIYIGQPVLTSDDNAVLFAGSGGQLNDDPNFTFIPADSLTLDYLGYTHKWRYGSYASHVDSVGNEVHLADGTYAVFAASGSIETTGTASNTFVWGSPGSPPTPGSVVPPPTFPIGGADETVFLSAPDQWVLIQIGVDPYVVPCYNPP